MNLDLLKHIDLPGFLGRHYGLRVNGNGAALCPFHYQWEALPDEGAREIITSAVDEYIDTDLIREADEEAEAFAKEWESKLEAVLDKIEQEQT
jgi:hypothetical protein